MDGLPIQPVGKALVVDDSPAEDDIFAGGSVDVVRVVNAISYCVQTS